MKTPVVLIIFNRPDLTRKVLEKIAEAKPEKLFIISDGPRKIKAGEELLVEETRAIVKEISWNCTVERKYSDSNLGCRKSVSSGLDWVFSHVDRAIILEDDCIPHPSFFPYCEELLEKYNDEPKIMHVSGSDLLAALPDNLEIDTSSNHSYYFSFLPSVWGWATWRRAWKHYDVKMYSWPDEKEAILNSHMPNKRARNFMEKRFNDIYVGKIDTWDYQWIFACWKNHGLAISPFYNLITNIGFSGSATHTKFETKFSYMKSNDIELPLRHPLTLTPDLNRDLKILQAMYPESLIFDILVKKIPFLRILRRFHS